MLGLTALPRESTDSDYGLRGYLADKVTGELIDPAVADDVILANLLYPSLVPNELMLAGIVRSYAFEGTVYLVYDHAPLRSGEFRLLELMEAGAIILIEQPASLKTVDEREAFVAYSIGETKGKVERVEVNGHVGLIGHGEIPQIRWWQDGLELFILRYLTDKEFITMAESMQPRA